MKTGKKPYTFGGWIKKNGKYIPKFSKRKLTKEEKRKERESYLRTRDLDCEMDYAIANER